MKKEDSGRQFSRALKLSAVQRMASGVNVSKLSRELGVSRKSLYQWQKQFRVGGPAALRGAGRPRHDEQMRMQANDPAVAMPPESSDELLKALARIAELERLVGQQTVDLDFFQQALQHVGGERRQSGAPGRRASTRSSKR